MNAITLDDDGNVVFGGSFNGTFNFGSQQLVSPLGGGQFNAVVALADGAPIKVNSWGSADTLALATMGSDSFDGRLCERVGRLRRGKMNAPRRDGFVAKHASDDSLTWLDRSLGNGDQIVTSVDVDGSGDAFVFGTYRWTTEIGPLLGSGPAGGDETDVFVGKRGAAGTPAWARHAGGTGADTIVGRVDAAGNAFVTGSHDGTIDFGTTNLVAGAGPQVYLAKLGPSGNELFAKQFTGNATATAITVTPGGAPMIAGFASNQVSLNGSSDVLGFYLGAFDSSGGYRWAEDFGGLASVIEPTAMVADANDTVYLMGTFSGSVQLLNCAVNASGSSDVFIARVSGPTHNVDLCRHFGSDKATAATSMGLDASGNFYFAGSFTSGINFGNGTLNSAGKSDIFVAKFDSNAALVWAKAFGGTGDDAAHALALAPNGDVVVVGSFSGTVDFGGGPMKSAGGSDAFMLRLDESGKTLLAARFGDSADGDAALAVAIDSANATLLGGTAGGAIDFGGGPATPAGALDGFLAKLNPAP